MNKLWPFAFALVGLILAFPATGPASTDSIVGKWVVQAETPQGPMELGFDLKLDGGQLVGTVTVSQSTTPVSTLKFEDPQLTMEINVMGGDFKLSGVLEDSKLSGTWEQIGGDMKGTWSAERAATPAPAAAAQSSAGFDGTWNSVAVTPDGELAFAVELKSSGSTVEGRISAGGVSLPIAKGTFTENKVSFEVEYAGGMYRFEATLAGDKLTGKWSAVDGTDGGAWAADRSKP